MKDSVAVALGLTAFVGGCATAGVFAASYVKGIDNKFTGIAKGLNYIQENVDLTVQPEVAEELVKVFAKEVAEKEVKKATEAACKEVQNDIKNIVKGNVRNAYAGIEDTLKNKLEKEINIQSLERIESKVSEKVAKQILSNYTQTWKTNGTSKADIAKACIDNGMDGFDVARVMSAIN